MFRKRNESDDGASKDSLETETVTETDPTPLTNPGNRTAQVPGRSTGTSGFHPDIPHRPSDSAAALKRPESKPIGSTEKSMGKNIEKKTLVVGQEIRLKGEITSCDKLVVEGHVEVSLTNGRQIEVGPNGVFTGDADVQEADVSGRFDGELVAHENLVVRSSGHVTGKIRYGRIVIESGGQISGQIEAISAAGGRGSGAERAPKSPASEPSSKAGSGFDAEPTGPNELELKTAASKD
jgi:cytoskeletal protein CcmA (bactofilin family)